MNTFFRFFYEFISIFFDGLIGGFKGLFNGFKEMFNISKYSQVIGEYKNSFNGNEKVFVVFCIILLVIIVAVIGLLIYLFVKKIIRRSSVKMSKDELLNEIANLNDQVEKLMKEKDELMAMKVSQLGLSSEDDKDKDKAKDKKKKGEEELGEEANADEDGIRFPALTLIDQRYKNYKVKKYDNNMTLLELIENFRCFAASQLKLYYEMSILRPFIAGLACGKLIILQGISGTGKTSLAYAWGKFVKNDSCVSSVEPSWRDKTDFLGYFNELTKKFNETRALGEIYEANYDDNVHTIILDEMNLARVEYYFADLLSILEMPTRDEWLVDIVSSEWPNDPVKLEGNKLRLPGNLWYIGTINNDDSTFLVTDKVYDRAMPIDINDKVPAFKCREQEAIDINSSYLEELFQEAVEKNPLSEKGLKMVNEMDDYIIEHFRIAFGNRIMKQLNVFSAVYVACGGKEIEAIDYFIAKKVLRKFDQLSVAFIRDEIDPFIAFLNKKYGKGTMKEMIAYLERTKKNI